MKYEELQQDCILSVIVPIYNVEEYITDCLDSVSKAITRIDAEVLLIDDGSKDGSSDIAKEYSLKDSRFRYYRKKNGGLSDARNYGVNLAKGKYLVFIDSDDMVTESAYEKMILSADANDADMTIINVARFDSNRTWVSSLHQIVFGQSMDTVTHISECPNLIYDTTAHNKLIRTSFYKQNEFEFPVGWRFEDMPVALKLHYSARRISIVREIGYLWRVRDGESVSITQENSNSINLEHRLKMLRKMLDEIVSQTDNPEYYFNILKDKVLRMDLLLYIDQFAIIDDKLKHIFYTLISSFYNDYFSIDDLVILPILARQKYLYLFSKDFVHLKKVIIYGRKAFIKAPYIYSDSSTPYIKLPDDIFSLKDRTIKNEYHFAYPHNNILDVYIKDDLIYIDAYVYVPKINTPQIDDLTIRAFIKNDISGETAELIVERNTDSFVTDLAGFLFSVRDEEVSEYNYDASLYTIVLNMKTIGDINTFAGSNIILIDYSTKYAEGSFILRNWKQLSRGYTNDTSIVYNDSRLKLNYDVVGNVIITFDSHCSTFSFDDYVNNNYYTVNDDNSDFLKLSTCSNQFVCIRSLSPQILNIQGNCNLLVAGKNRVGRIYKSNTFAFVKNAEATKTEMSLTICVKGIVDTNYIYQLVYYDSLQGEYITLGTANRDDVNFKSELCYLTFHITCFNQDLLVNLYNGYKPLKIKIDNKCDNSDEKFLDILADGSFMMQFQFETINLRFLSVDNYLFLLSIPRWKYDENSVNKRAYYRRHDYKEFRKLPIDQNTILFESYWGNQYSDNPRYLYEYIDRNYPDYRCVISLKDDRIPINGNGIRVKKYSKDYYYYLATAKYLVNNVNFEDFYKKRNDQVEIQTMHGTPYKIMGLDLDSDFKSDKARVDYIKRNRRWNYMVVQGRFSKEMAWQWFRFDKTFLQTGYPRTDQLFNVEDSRIVDLKQKLNIPVNKKVLLYAPTFRTKKEYKMPLDLDLLKEKLSDEFVILIRLHHFVRELYSVPEDRVFVFDVCDYNSVEDLFLISDALITDYSSVMFDYALTQKPILYFANDLEQYEKEIRGGYFDLKVEGPGPLLTDTESLIECLKDLSAVADNYREKYNTFLGKYLSFESDRSCEQIFEQVFVNKHIRKRVILKNLAVKTLRTVLSKRVFRKARNKRIDNLIK